MPTRLTAKCIHSSSRLNKLEAFRHKFGDILVLVLQESKREGDIVPLPLRIATRQTRGQLLGQLFGMFVLQCLRKHMSLWVGHGVITFSTNPSKNRTIL